MNQEGVMSIDVKQLGEVISEGLEHRKGEVLTEEIIKERAGNISMSLYGVLSTPSLLGNGDVARAIEMAAQIVLAGDIRGVSPLTMVTRIRALVKLFRQKGPSPDSSP